MTPIEDLQKICKLIRYDIITSTTQAESGHATSSLSAVELMTTLFFGGPPAGGFFRYDLNNPKNPANDRVIFSKGHASPLLYSLYHAAGAISYDELMTLRTFGSNLEGHPTPHFKYVDVATGSLGQGLSVGVGMALGINFKLKISNLKLERKPQVFVLLGDSEMAEGQIWEAMQIASYYKLDNLIGIIDVNRLGQRGETMLEWDLQTYAKRAESFGWSPIIIEDGNDLKQVYDAYLQINQRLGKPDKSDSPENLDSLSLRTSQKPKMIIAKTIKGKGVSFLEDKNGWHGKPIPKERLQDALKELGEVDLKVRGKIERPSVMLNSFQHLMEIPKQVRDDNAEKLQVISYKLQEKVATRDAYGDALVVLGKEQNDLLVLDAELSNSTHSDRFKKEFPDRFFEMFIAEQNMISVALGLEVFGYKVFSSTFGAFFTRAFDQIRMAQYSNLDLRMVGSHTGVFMGKDGPSQMGLEDFAMIRSILNSNVLCGADAVSTFKLTEQMLETPGISYLRTMRAQLPLLYESTEKFPIGGSKILRKSSKDVAVVFATGVCVHEALKAADELKKEQISICVVDVYSIKPIDKKTVKELSEKIKNVIVVEDHYPYGGLGEAVMEALLPHFKFQISNFKFSHLCVKKLPRSGSSEDLMRYEEIDARAILQTIREII